MGRNMFGGGPGPWGEDPWDGWWGEEPPFHVPVYVLTNHEREPLEMDGGTTFHFVTDGIETALEEATAAAGGARRLDRGWGGRRSSSTLAAGLVDEMWLHVVPVLLGAGAACSTRRPPARLRAGGRGRGSGRHPPPLPPRRLS